MQKLWRIAASALVVLALAYFVWPMPWAKGVVDGDSVRTNRFSGCTFTMTKSGWFRTDMRDQCLSASELREADRIKEQMLSDAKWIASQSKTYEAGKLSTITKLQDAKLSISSMLKTATAEIYNPTSCGIKGITINLNGRKYESRLYTSYGEQLDIFPNSTGTREFQIFNPDEGIDNWYIEDIDYGSFPESEGLRIGDPTCLNN